MMPASIRPEQSERNDERARRQRKQGSTPFQAKVAERCKKTPWFPLDGKKRWHVNAEYGTDPISLFKAA